MRAARRGLAFAGGAFDQTCRLPALNDRGHNAECRFPVVLFRKTISSSAMAER
jgi:hypothetical protein